MGLYDELYGNKKTKAKSTPKTSLYDELYNTKAKSINQTTDKRPAKQHYNEAVQLGTAATGSVLGGLSKVAELATGGLGRMVVGGITGMKTEPTGIEKELIKRRQNMEKYQNQIVDNNIIKTGGNLAESATEFLAPGTAVGNIGKLGKGIVYGLQGATQGYDQAQHLTNDSNKIRANTLIQGGLGATNAIDLGLLNKVWGSKGIGNITKAVGKDLAFNAAQGVAQRGITELANQKVLDQQPNKNIGQDILKGMATDTLTNLVLGYGGNTLSILKSKIKEGKATTAEIQKGVETISKETGKAPEELAQPITQNKALERTNVPDDTITPIKQEQGSNAPQIKPNSTIKGTEQPTNQNATENTVKGNTIGEEIKPIQDVLNLPLNKEMQTKANNIESHDEAVDAYGAFEPGMQPRRDVQIAKETDMGPTSKFYRTAAEAKATSEPMVEDIKAKVGSGEGAYVIQSDQRTLDKVNENLDRIGYDASVTEMDNKFSKGERFNKEDMVTLQRLYQEAQAKGDMQKATDIISNLAILGTEQGQSIQALSMIKKLSPEGRLMTVEKLVNRENTKLTDKQRQKIGGNIELPQELKEKILTAGGQKELDQAVNDALVDLANKTPLTIGDKIRSWRYISMLGNPRTHIRNMLSNAAMKTTASVKNKVSGAIEDIVSIFKPIERTKTVGIASPEQKAFAKQDALEIRDRISGNNKYELNQKRAFENKVLNKIAEGNSNLLEKEDWLFSSSAYQDALANYMKANKYTPEFLSNGTKEANIALEKGRNLAIKEAQEQTFRQYSDFAQKLSNLENMNNVTKVAVGAIMPFKKTPINIAKAGYEYSPLRLIQSVGDFTKGISSGKKTVNEAIDGLAKGLTGTAIMALGAFLADKGVLRASGSSENKEEYFQESQGKQPYSVEIGGKSYTLDWLSPTAMPLFAGAEAYNLSNQKDNLDDTKLMAMMDGASKLMDPLTQMSMLQGVNSTLQSYNASSSVGGYVGATGLNAVQNYAGQFIPTILGQTARTIDDTRRSTTGAGKGIDKIVNTFVNKQKAKIPFVSKTLEPYTDQFGNKEVNKSVVNRAIQNFVSPAYIKDLKSNNIDKELQRLYDKTGDKKVLPASSSRSFTNNGQKIYLTPEEYTKFNQKDGQTVTSSLKALVKTQYYKNLSDEAKAKVIQAVYDYGQQVAKYDYLKNKD